MQILNSWQPMLGFLLEYYEKHWAPGQIRASWRPIKSRAKGQVGQCWPHPAMPCPWRSPVAFQALKDEGLSQLPITHKIKSDKWSNHNYVYEHIWTIDAIEIQCGYIFVSTCVSSYIALYQLISCFTPSGCPCNILMSLTSFLQPSYATKNRVSVREVLGIGCDFETSVACLCQSLITVSAFMLGLAYPHIYFIILDHAKTWAVPKSSTMLELSAVLESQEWIALLCMCPKASLGPESFFSPSFAHEQLHLHCSFHTFWPQQSSPGWQWSEHLEHILKIKSQHR